MHARRGYACGGDDSSELLESDTNQWVAVRATHWLVCMDAAVLPCVLPGGRKYSGSATVVISAAQEEGDPMVQSPSK